MEQSIEDVFMSTYYMSEKINSFQCLVSSYSNCVNYGIGSFLLRTGHEYGSIELLWNCRQHTYRDFRGRSAELRA